jgi:hypothetical protein
VIVEVNTGPNGGVSELITSFSLTLVLRPPPPETLKVFNPPLSAPIPTVELMIISSVALIRFQASREFALDGHGFSRAVPSGEFAFRA